MPRPHPSYTASLCVRRERDISEAQVQICSLQAELEAEKREHRTSLEVQQLSIQLMFADQHGSFDAESTGTMFCRQARLEIGPFARLCTNLQLKKIDCCSVLQEHETAAVHASRSQEELKQHLTQALAQVWHGCLHPQQFRHSQVVRSGYERSGMSSTCTAFREYYSQPLSGPIFSTESLCLQASISHQCQERLQKEVSTLRQDLQEAISYR